MKFLLDENISPATANFLKDLGYNVKSLEDFKMLGCENGEVIKLAIKENRTLITLDMTFGYRFYFLNRGKVGILLLRLKNVTVGNVNQVLKNFLDPLKKEKKRLGKSLIVIEEEGYRIIK